MTLIAYYALMAFAVGLSFTLGCIAGVWIGMSVAAFFDFDVE